MGSFFGSHHLLRIYEQHLNTAPSNKRSYFDIQRKMIECLFQYKEKDMPLMATLT